MIKFIALFFILISQYAAALPTYTLDGLKTNQLIDDYWKITTNQQQNLALANVIKLNKAQLQRVQSKVFTASAAPQGNWYVIELANSYEKKNSVYISILNSSLIADMQLYSQTNSLAPEDLALKLNSNNFRVSHVTIPAQSKTQLYIFVVSDHDVNFSVHIYNDKSFLRTNRKQQFISGIAIGGIVCLALIEMLSFFASGLKSTLLLTGYFITRAMLLAVLLGYNLFYLLPQMPELRGVDLPMLNALASIFYLWFTIELFNFKQVHYKLTRYIRYFCWLLLFYIPLSLLLSITANTLISLFIFISTSLISIVVSYCLIQNHNRLGALLALTSVLQLIFIGVIIIGSTWFEVNFMTYHQNIFFAAFWLNGLLISFLLSRQNFFESQDKEIAQQQALESAVNSKNSQYELLSLQKESQEMLEQHVQERTLELNIALQELEEANQELARKNTLDELTGLNNRRFYDQKILAEFRRSKRNLTNLSLVLIDIDHFKKVNDTYGHQAGDYCLQQIANLMKASLKRSTDIGCRYGGEEFCLILPDTDTIGAIEFAEILRQKVSQESFEYDGITLQINISCGVSTYKQQDNIGPEQIFAAADKGLYQAKNKGRNQTWQFAIEDL